MHPMRLKAHLISVYLGGVRVAYLASQRRLFGRCWWIPLGLQLTSFVTSGKEVSFVILRVLVCECGTMVLTPRHSS